MKLLLLEATNSYRRTNLMLSHLLFAIHLLKSTDGCTPCASDKQMVFWKFKILYQWKPQPTPKKQQQQKKTQNPHNHTAAHSWILGFFSFSIHIMKMALQTQTTILLLPWEQQHLFFVKHVWRQRRTIQLNWLNILCTWNVDNISSWQAEAAQLTNSSPTPFVYKTHIYLQTTAHRHTTRQMNAFCM